MTTPTHATAFAGSRQVAAGALADVVLAVKALQSRDPTATCLVFDDVTGRVIDLDLRGTDGDIRMRYAPQEESAPRTGRGRPALGVTAREVTLLPAQWDWLAQQSRNMSATLRHMIEEARRAGNAERPRKLRQETAYRVATALAGDQPGYEEAMRALFADDAAAFAHHTAAWPADIRDYATRLAFAGAVRKAEPALIVLGGRPGTGKTTIARLLAARLRAVHLRIDTIEQGLHRSGVAEPGIAGYAVGQQLAAENLSHGLTVIADSVNPVAAAREGWRAAAERAGASIVEVELVCSDPAQHRRRVEGRRADIPGHVLPDWPAVEALDFEPWPGALRIDTATRTADATARMIVDQLTPALAQRHLEPTQSAGAAFVRPGLTGPVVMLNLLRFRAVADYSAHPDLAPPAPITGKAAFDRYVEHTLPFLRASGGELLFLGEGDSFLIGPAEEAWDCAMLVRQASVESFLAFAQDAGHLAGLGHRVAAVADSRLLPLQERPR